MFGAKKMNEKSKAASLIGMITVFVLIAVFAKFGLLIAKFLLGAIPLILLTGLILAMIDNLLGDDNEIE